MSREPDDLTAFTRCLANVPPHPGQLDRDALLFAAGQAAGRRSSLWPVTSVALVVLSAVLTVTLLTRPPTVVERVVHVPAPAAVEAPTHDPVPGPEDSSAPPPTVASPSLAEALRERARLLRDGAGEPPPTRWMSGRSTPFFDDVPDLSSLRIRTSQPDGELIR
jgi:hypothetical protein